ncbi:MAG: lamin tail domain-containing protein, partial [Thermoguttaceae bacterium]
IEIHNPTGTAVDLDGWHLTDDDGDLDQWQFPAVTIDPNEYLVVFASNKDRAVSGFQLHTNFELDGAGEYLALVKPDRITISSEFDPEYPRQEGNISYGMFQEVIPLFSADADTRYRVPTAADAAADWTERTFDDSTWESGGTAPTIVVTEAGNGTPDYVEIQNVSNQTVNTDGWVLALNRPNDPNAGGLAYNGLHTPWNLPPSMAPGEVIYVNDVTPAASNPNYFGEGIVWSTSAQGWAMIVDNDGEVADFAPWSYSNADLANMNVTINGANIRASSAWSGAGLPTSAGKTTMQRVGNLDHDDLTDFVFVPPDLTNLGFTNPGLVLPLAGARMPGIGFSSLPGAFGGMLATDLTTEMYQKNASVWARIRFQVDDPADLASLTLKMRYNDGFMAYLNGHPVASSNAPGTPQWDSNATASQTIAQSNEYESFLITSGLEHLTDGTNVLAIQGLNVSASDGNFLLMAQLDGAGVEMSHRYFSTPTPGGPNEADFLGFVKDTKFSEDRGFYEMSFDIAITSATPGASIRYTTDGSEPTEADGELYTAAITIDTTTVLRAAAFKPGYRPTNVDTQTYLFVDDIVQQTYQATLDAGFPASWGSRGADYGLDPDVIGPGDNYGGVYAASIRDDLKAIPTISLVMDIDDMFGPSGIYSNSGSRGVAWERAASAELIYPDGQEGFQVDAGIRIHGGAARSMSRKNSLRLLFKKQYGPTKLDFPLFGEGVDRFDTVVLRAHFNDGWGWSGAGGDPLFSRDMWHRQTQEAMGSVSSRGIGVHLYINGIYWGIYNPSERPDASFAAQHLGGDKTEWDSINHGGVIDGNNTAWNTMKSMASGVANAVGDVAKWSAYQAIQGNDPMGNNDPQRQDFLDVENYIDYLLLSFYSGNHDWSGNNWFAARRRGPESEGFQFFAWDSEISMTLSGRTHLYENRLGVTAGVTEAYARLKNYDQFQLAFADRVQKHFAPGGVFYVDPDNPAVDPAHPERNVPGTRFAAIASAVFDSVVAESARWGDQHRSPPYTRNGEWQTSLNYMKSIYFPQRTSIVMGQLLSAGLFPSTDTPSHSIEGQPQNGGDVAVGAQLTMANPNGAGVIYYTTDGTDPRHYDPSTGATASGTAITYSAGAPISITGSTTIKSRVLNGGEWSALNETEFYVHVAASADNLVITEINYNPYDPTDAELLVDPAFIDEDFEFIELKNIGDETVNLADVRFAAGVTFQFTGNEEFLDAGRFVVIAKVAAAFEARYGVAPDHVYDGGLRNGGEQITLRSRLGDPIVEFEYNDTGKWPGRADGSGASLELIDPTALPPDAAERIVYLEGGTHWRGSSEYGGSPWADGQGPITDVVVNEVLTHTDFDDLDSIELYNTTAFAIDLGGWYLSDTNDAYGRYRIPDGTEIPGGGYLVFDENDFNFNTLGGADPLLYPNEFALNGAHGDDVWLMRTDDEGKLTHFIDHVEFPDAAQGESFGRWPNGTGKLYPMTRNTPGTGNSGPRVGPLILSEVHYNQNNIENEPGIEYDRYLEFVEIYNPTSETIDLTGWRLRKGIDFDFDFATPTELAAQATLVVVSFDPNDVDRLTAFRDEYSIDASVTLFGPYSGKLENAGEKVQLQRPDTSPLDEPNYTPYLIEDEVIYSNLWPWPEADGTGDSLNRLA